PRPSQNLDPELAPAFAADRRMDQAFLRFQTTGNPDDLAEVFDLSATRLLRVAMHLSRDRNDAEDLVQAVFLVAIERRHDYRRRAGVMGWLLGILNDLVRRRRRMDGYRERFEQMPPRQHGNPSSGLPVGEPDPGDFVLGKELSESVVRAIESLPVTY